MTDKFGRNTSNIQSKGNGGGGGRQRRDSEGRFA